MTRAIVITGASKGIGLAAAGITANAVAPGQTEGQLEAEKLPFRATSF